MTHIDEFVMTTPDWQVGLPADAINALEQFILDARAALSNDLDSIVLFGSTAEGRLRPASDVNLIVVLNRFDDAIVNAWKPALEVNVAEIDLQLMFLLKDELREASEASAIRFSDILMRRRVLFGNDPFESLNISREARIHGVQQMLFDLILRLRHATLVLDEDGQTHVIVDSIGPLRSITMVLLQLDGRHVQSPREGFTMLADQLGTEWCAVIEHLSEMYEQGLVVESNISHILNRMLALVTLLYQRSRKL
ncbi:MAG: nucleotidyltransferase domain-containing protein [Steroidobacter sp.]